MTPSPVAPSSLPLFPQLAEMNEGDKFIMIARYLPCELCSPNSNSTTVTCRGWRPKHDKGIDNENDNERTCKCGHDIQQHVDKGQDLERRLRVALRLKELLEEKGRTNDYEYEDEDIASLKKQILYNAEGSNDALPSPQGAKRNRGDFEKEQDVDSISPEQPRGKRNKTNGSQSTGKMTNGQETFEEDQKQTIIETHEKDYNNEQRNVAVIGSTSNDTDIAIELVEEDAKENTDKHEDREGTISGREKMELTHDNTLHEIDDRKTLHKTNEHIFNIDEECNTDVTSDEDNDDENSQTDTEERLEEYMPKVRKETPAMKEEKEGTIRVQVVVNDCSRESVILLTGLKNVFQKQLPKMPKEYISRLVYDRNHCSIALIRNSNKVIGGICYRPFDAQEFAEIVFCAVASTEQVKGYGSYIMNHLKDYISTHTPIKHFLTYADNFAVGYFRKQGFTTEITLDKRKWVGYIKDYEGGTIMQCTIIPKMKYMSMYDILAIQKNAVLKKIKEKATDHIVYPGVHMEMGSKGKRSIDPLTVPGIKESGWTPEMDILSNKPRHAPHYNQMLHIVEEMQNFNDAWPFLEPVSIEEVADYYDIIKEPMDLATLEENVKNDAYPKWEDFIKDTRKIFENCRTYNAEDTEYAKCAARLEKFFNDKLRGVKRKS